MKGYFRSWDIMRIFRLLLSVAVIIGGATTKDWTLTSLGGLFCFMQIFNVGVAATLQVVVHLFPKLILFKKKKNLWRQSGVAQSNQLEHLINENR